MTTIGAILVVIGILSVPIQIKFILREMRLSYVFKLYLDSASEIALDVELFSAFINLLFENLSGDKQKICNVKFQKNYQKLYEINSTFVKFCCTKLYFTYAYERTHKKCKRISIPLRIFLNIKEIAAFLKFL